MITGDSTSRIINGRVDAVAEPWPLILGRRPIIYAHSAASDARESIGWSLPSVRTVTQKIVDVLSNNVVAYSSPNTVGWGPAGLITADALALPEQGKIEAAVTYHQATYGSSGPIGLFGTSMGSLNSFIYALEHPTNVRWMVLFSPLFDPVAYEAGNTAGNGGVVRTSWGVGAAPLPSKADIFTRRAELIGIPILLIDSSDDPYSAGGASPIAAHYSTFVTDIGASRQALGAVGHGEGTVAASDLAAIVAFIQAHT